MVSRSAPLIAAGLLALATSAHALPSVTVLSSTAGVTNAAAAADNVVPPNFTVWNNLSGWWFGTGESITFKLDQPYYLSSATITADWNDVYRFSASTDGVNFVQVFTVTGLTDQPLNANVNAGQVTMPVSFAQTAFAYSYIRVQAIAGDNSYSIGEVNFNGVAAPVPEPSTLAFMAAGVGMLGMLARRRRRA